MFGLTYLCVDPILKTIYALRCFYGESLQSGEDLEGGVETVHQHRGQNRRRHFDLARAFFRDFGSGGSGHQRPAAPVSGHSLSPPDLDRAINQTIHERKYVWRMPREQTRRTGYEAEGHHRQVFRQESANMIRDWARDVSDWLEKLLRKAFSGTRGPSSRHRSGYGWIMSLQILLYGLVAAAIAALAVFLIPRLAQPPPRAGHHRQRSHPASARSGRRKCPRRPVAGGRLDPACARTARTRRIPPGHARVLSRQPRASCRAQPHQHRPLQIQPRIRARAAPPRAFVSGPAGHFGDNFPFSSASGMARTRPAANWCASLRPAWKN